MIRLNLSFKNTLSKVNISFNNQLNEVDGYFLKK